MEVDDIISYHDVVTAENWGAQATSLLVSAASRNDFYSNQDAILPHRNPLTMDE
jgi:hypothetical protein